MIKYLSKKALVLLLAGSIEFTASTVNCYAMENVKIEKQVSKNVSLHDTKDVKIIVAKENVNIRANNNIDSEVYGVLGEGQSLKTLGKMYNGWYKVVYRGKIAYVCADYVEEMTKKEFDEPFKKVVYLKEDAEIFTYDSKTIDLPKLESAQVYGVYGKYYLVESAGYIGYIEKDKTEDLTDDFVIVDISDQELKYYKDNEVKLETKVVTGKPSTPSDEGLFEVYEITSDRYLRGPGYKSYVNVMMAYNGGEGLHDATWRADYEFGGPTHLSNGSHGCINMPKEDALALKEDVKLGTKVLVKK